ncbi:hypothetical protein DFR96_005229 [Clostridium beijerinckii]|uniref:hypothetical protein n=1 Tax=Clostridium beijerinckii TaxID=1520 RepID=UPI0030CA187A|nr:hypothetical protein [Clostridium beijerinckii]
MIPTIVDAIVPIIYWPSAPILNNPVLKANATLKPVKIIGVALIIVLDIYLGFEKIPLKSALKASIELYPAIPRTIAETTKPKNIAMNVEVTGFFKNLCHYFHFFYLLPLINLLYFHQLLPA